MTVLVCIPCLMSGGTEIQTLSLVKALVTVGHRPVVACYFEYDAGMVERYRRAGAEVELLSAEGERPAGVMATVMHLWRGLRRVVRRYRPDVVHIQYMAPGAIPIILLRLIGVKRIIATTHTNGDIYSPSGLRIIRLLTYHVLTAFQCITLRAEDSFFGSSQLFDPNGPMQRHFTIYNNIPSHISIADTEREHDHERLTVGVVSRLEAIKGMDFVVPAFAIAARKNPGLRLLVVGDGSQRELMENQAIAAGLRDKVEFVGRQPQSYLQLFYDRIDILLMPSRSEGFGLTAIEGMARGCVPIVADTGGLPEVVIDREVGLLHRVDDVDDLAAKINLLIEDNRLYEKIQLALPTYARRFGFDKYIEAVNSLYSKL